MQRDNVRIDGRAVSAVISVLLMLAITVLLAATATVFVTGLSGATAGDTPAVVFDFDYSQSGGSDELTISHASGDPVDAGAIVVRLSGADYRDADSDPNGQYPISQFGTLSGDSHFTDESAVTITGGTVDGSATQLDLSAATVEITWHGPDGERSRQFTAWSNV